MDSPDVLGIAGEEFIYSICSGDRKGKVALKKKAK
jgi:hypothetical protein